MTVEVNLNIPNNDPGISVTSVAHDFIKNALAKASEPNPLGIRLGVKKAGCSGYEYILEYVYAKNGPNETDFVFPFEDFAIIVDKEIYLKFLKGGLEVDFVKESLKEGLKFNNPNVTGECGCGESFTLKEEV